MTSDSVKSGNDKPVRVGYDLNARQELLRTYTEKEVELSERLDKERKSNKNMKMEILGLRQYARNL